MPLPNCHLPQLRYPTGLGREPETPCRPATRTNKHAPQKSVSGRGPTGSAQRCAGVRKRGLAEPDRETVKRFPKGKHLTNPTDRSRVRSETGSAVRDAIRINNDNETPSWLRPLVRGLDREVNCQKTRIHLSYKHREREAT